MRGDLRARLHTDQNTAAQVDALRRYAAARGWEAVAYVDHGVSGAKELRPVLDALLSGARRRKVGVVVVTKLDGLARSLHQVVALGRHLDDEQVTCQYDAAVLLGHAMERLRKFGAWVFPLLVGLVAVLTPMAYASPPDPAWLPGVYDDDDFDNVVVFITSGTGVVSLASPVEPRFVLPRITPVVDRTVGPVPTLARSSQNPRAPPAP